MQNRNNRFTAVLLSGLLALGGTAHVAAGYFGHGAPSSAAALPAGDFRSALEALPDEAGQRAIQWLQSIEFTGHDLASMRVDGQGGIYYADRFASTGSAGGNTADGVAAKRGVSDDSVLKLHSRPGAGYTIFIDFDRDVAVHVVVDPVGIVDPGELHHDAVRPQALVVDDRLGNAEGVDAVADRLLRLIDRQLADVAGLGAGELEHQAVAGPPGVPADEVALDDVVADADRALERDEEGKLAYGPGRSSSLAFGKVLVDLGRDATWEELVEASRTQQRVKPIALEVTKVGFEGLVYRFAFAYPFVYGVLAVVMAVLS